DRAEERVEAAGEPHQQDGRRASELAGDHAGRAKDADAERAADDHGKAEAEPEHAPQRVRRRGRNRRRGGHGGGHLTSGPRTEDRRPTTDDQRPKTEEIRYAGARWSTGVSGRRV